MPRTSTLRAAAAATAVAWCLLAILVGAARELPGDTALLEACTESGLAYDVAHALDRLTDSVPLGVLTAAVVAVLLWRRRRRDALLTAVAVAGTMLGNVALKHLVDRPRPSACALTDVSPLSFPSGHAAASVAVAISLALATRQVAGVIAAVALVLVTAAAQLALGNHYASDVVGGWLWATAWALTGWSLRGRVRPRPAA